MRVIKNYDVGSYYPHLCTINGYTSRNIPSPQIYTEVLENRMKAKASGDKATANALKLVCNTTYGAMLNRYNDLYDPLMGRSVCISGQLYLLELANHLYRDVPDLRVVQLNTDGIMVEFDDSQYNTVLTITKEWEQRTGFELEEDSVKKIAQKDVNNYVEVQPNGEVKEKGGYLVKGISSAGAWNINNSCCIVATALREYFVNGTPVEDTINACDDIFQFQIIAKAGAKYCEAYHLVEGERVPVQKVNRVYATTDPRYGKLFKVKAENNSTAKIEMLPEHCIIDNNNQLTISNIDKSFYIKMANKRVNDFLGIKPEKSSRRRNSKMSTSTVKKPEAASLNVYQKLLIARDKFLDANVKKSGKNMKLTYMYFELSDIVPIAVPIFTELGLLPLVTFDNEQATMTIVNTDKPDETIVFTSPMREIEVIVSSRTGGEVTNAIQRLGSVETYQRRYLYMTALDVVESDSIEPMTGSSENTKLPATAEQRNEVRKELTSPSENATALQIKGLKAVLKKLKDSDPSKEELIAAIAVQTKGFTEISKSDCEALITKVTGILEEGSNEQH